MSAACLASFSFVIFFIVANDLTCRGACGIRPLTGGRPNIEHKIIRIPTIKKS